ncbi:dicarboxylate/amino acid:cation symporter [Hyphobacterium sp. HN65]|uniref:Dicarboxylate/amino acid:cation symporter n=1 Tax=Hyphobacterium lacteum TaxID=3116575 RepID=A0ABU7LP14_9PROT|nr:dicarboxylate/amino acid:cation symporter [Hyphobacterium sp. HN65]MEE2525339.1 dicarboxylate/amino acid:cation symporter [Hyphobacterium sp. HN65]
MTEARRIRTRELRKKLESWIRARLWAQVIAALLIGGVTGFLIGPDTGWITPETSELAGRLLALPGGIFLNLIQMVLMPLVAASIVLGLAAGASDPEKLRRLGGRLALYIGATTLFAASLGAVMALWLRPGASVIEPDWPMPRLRPDPDSLTDPVMQAATQAPDLIARVVPSNPLAAAADSEMLAVVVFAVFVGMAFVASGNRERLEPLKKLFEAMLEVAMTVVKWAMHLTPLAVFGLTAQLVARMGLSAITTLAAYVGLVLAGLAILLTLYLGLVAILGRMSPLAFLKAVFPVQLLAFSTSSSAAVMPLSLETARNRLGTPGDTASFIIPLAATMNMAGTALYQSIAVVFVAQVAGVSLAPPEVALIVMSLVAASIGAPGAPGVSVAILSGMLATFGIPAEGLVFVLGVDRLLDMSRTVVNVTGDLAACRILSRSEVNEETAATRD